MPEFDSPEVGAEAPFWPVVAMSQLFDYDGALPNPANPMPAGTMAMVRTFAGRYRAYGMLNSEGGAFLIQSRQDLYNLIGNVYGGDGQTTFALPDLRGRVALGGGPGQPSNPQGLSMAYLIAVRGQATHWPLAGSIALYAASPAGATLPGGWLPADGRLLPIAQYPDLFNAIRTSFGGDGQTSFALPDLGGSAPIGTGQGVVVPPVGLGQQFPYGGPWGFAGMGLFYLICGIGQVPPAYGLGHAPAGDAMLGEVVAYAGLNWPDGWFDASGQSLPIDHPLFQLFGTTYGGDGQTNFNLPNLCGRMITALTL